MGASAPAFAPASASTKAMTSPTATESPSCLTIFDKTPSAGAGNSIDALSVSNSTMVSSR